MRDESTVAEALADALRIEMVAPLPSTTTYSWDFHNRLSGVSYLNPYAEVMRGAAYEYDVFGKRGVNNCSDHGSNELQSPRWSAVRPGSRNSFANTHTRALCSQIP